MPRIKVKCLQRTTKSHRSCLKKTFLLQNFIKISTFPTQLSTCTLALDNPHFAIFGFVSINHGIGFDFNVISSTVFGVRCFVTLIFSFFFRGAGSLNFSCMKTETLSHKAHYDMHSALSLGVTQVRPAQIQPNCKNSGKRLTRTDDQSFCLCTNTSAHAHTLSRTHTDSHRNENNSWEMFTVEVRGVWLLY